MFLRFKIRRHSSIQESRRSSLDVMRDGVVNFNNDVNAYDRSQLLKADGAANDLSLTQLNLSLLVDRNTPAPTHGAPFPG